jgi:hypothetical protein
MSNTGFYPEVLQVVPTKDYKVYAYMNDGSIRLYDVSLLIKEDTVFAPLADIDIFTKTATVMNGTVAWDIEGSRDDRRCIDIDPFSIYQAEAVNDPLAAA